MIAVCPTCHRQMHYGRLVIDDNTIRQWKQIQRTTGPIRECVYVEPGDDCSVLLGSLILTGGPNAPRGLTAFQLSTRNRLGFSVIDGTALALNLSVADTRGRDVIRVVDSHLTIAPVEPVRHESRTGKHTVTALATDEYIPEWVIAGQAVNAPETLVENEQFTVLDVEVMKPGLVEVHGVWVEDDRALVVVCDWLSICPSRDRGFFHVKGYGDNRAEAKNLSRLPVFRYEGPITLSVIGAAFRLPGF